MLFSQPQGHVKAVHNHCQVHVNAIHSQLQVQGNAVHSHSQVHVDYLNIIIYTQMPVLHKVHMQAVFGPS